VLVKPRMDPSSEGLDGTTSDDLTNNERQEAFYQYQDAIDAKLEIWWSPVVYCHNRLYQGYCSFAVTLGRPFLDWLAAFSCSVLGIKVQRHVTLRITIPNVTGVPLILTRARVLRVRAEPPIDAGRRAGVEDVFGGAGVAMLISSPYSWRSASFTFASISAVKVTMTCAFMRYGMPRMTTGSSWSRMSEKEMRGVMIWWWRWGRDCGGDEDGRRLRGWQRKTFIRIAYMINILDL